jgi:hypothetical protein
MIEFEGDNESCYKMWIELTWAMEGNTRELAWINRKIVEIHHIMHFLEGLLDPFLYELLENGFTTWIEFG